MIQCPKIGEPANGIIVRSSHVFLGVTEFACDEGYSLVGNSSSVCMSNGNWSSNAPKCQGEFPINSPHIFPVLHCLVPRSRKDGQVIDFVCADKFERHFPLGPVTINY